MYAACAECVVVAAVRRDASSAELGCGCTRREYVAGRWVGAGGLCVGMGRGMGAASEDGRQPKKNQRPWWCEERGTVRLMAVGLSEVWRWAVSRVVRVQVMPVARVLESLRQGWGRVATMGRRVRRVIGLQQGSGHMDSCGTWYETRNVRDLVGSARVEVSGRWLHVWGVGEGRIGPVGRCVHW